MHVVWFKRDLRIDDHAPLAQAAASGSEVLCLYAYEPEILQSAEFDTSHLEFLNRSLSELDASLRKRGNCLTYRVGSMPEVLAQLHAEHHIEAIWSHEETGDRGSYDRDLRVAAWADQKKIAWKEIPQNGVVRRLKSRDGWSKQRNIFMAQPLARPPSEIKPAQSIETGKIQSAQDLGLEQTTKTDLQIGGEKAALRTLSSFLHNRGENYSTEMSSPVTAASSCSRLSTYLAWGCISMKRIVHALRERQAELSERKAAGEPIGAWSKSLRAYDARLSWHCHFMQKLEDEPAIEFQNMSRIYDGLREDEFSQSRFDAWCHGQTGYPMVDACMRALLLHSWINFRMRAMLVSFASYHLWLHWRPTAVFLAQHFLDYEPGIHFSQFQMQSGTTGINTVRIYSPIKQVKDQDPSGQFIRRFVPELAGVPDKHLAEPHKMTHAEQSQSGCRINKDYPAPIVEHAVAYKKAKARVYEVRGQKAAREEAVNVVKKHGSRKGSNDRNRKSKSSKKTEYKQGRLSLE
ncbi:MAG: deoxyribodipyrimidine photo-lyase [Planctomycetota bacterium]|nr:deoxyribodipyrimidine photo-lyase [Planctomycetota bacterium]